MAISGLTAKSVRNLMKRGHGMKYFCEKYECTPEDIAKSLRVFWKNDTHTADDLLKRMELNDKKAKPTKSKVLEEPLSKDAADEEAKDEANEASEEICAMTLDEKLAKLKADEDELSAEVMRIESHHKDLAGAHRDHIIRIRQINDEIEEVRLIFKAKCDEYEREARACDDLAIEMNRASEERRVRVLELEAIRQKIEELNVLEVGVYSDGKIEVFDHPGLELDDTGFETVFSRIVGQAECRKLTVAGVETLARLIRAIELSNAKINAIFDDQEMEIAFLILTEEPDPESDAESDAEMA